MTSTAPYARVVPLDELERLFDRQAIIAAVADAFVAQARGDVMSPPPGHLVFPENDGDCHIKYGAIRKQETFIVKVATGFPRNGSMGLPVSGGCVLVFSSQTGQLRSVLLDGGWLTSWRTAAAGCLAATALARPDIDTIAIIGTGLQARLQGQWLGEAFPRCRVLVAGRSVERAETTAAALRGMGVKAQAVQSIASAVRAAGLIHTVTASHAPLIDRSDIQPGTHITAIGSDTPGKQELDPALMADAAVIAVDDQAQCLDHGELGWAVRQGWVDASAGIPLGTILDEPARGRASAKSVTVADLTGTAAQDVAIAALLMRRLEGAQPVDTRECQRRDEGGALEIV